MLSKIRYNFIMEKNKNEFPAGAKMGDEERKRCEEEAREIIQKTMENADGAIGQGKVATVWKSERYENVCYKVVYDYTAYFESNTIYEEGAFLEELSDFTVNGVRTPELYFYVEQDGLVVLVMENLSAVSLKNVINGAELPKQYDEETFWNDLLVYVEQLHKRGIFHRDIQAGNIMIDVETGKPRMIDFGDAVKKPDDSKDFAVRKDHYGREIIESVGNDIENMEESRNDFLLALKKKNKKQHA